MGVNPRLIHPVDVVIRISNRAGTRMDPNMREPVQRIAQHGVITLKGQIRQSVSRRDVSIGQGGRQENERGYILFRRADLVKALDGLDKLGVDYDGWTNSLNGAVNDVIVSAGDQNLNGYITRLVPLGHYDGKAKLVKVFFADRTPSRRTGAT